MHTAVAMAAPAAAAMGLSAPPLVSGKPVPRLASPPTTLAACYISDGSKSSNASPARVSADARHDAHPQLVCSCVPHVVSMRTSQVCRDSARRSLSAARLACEAR